MSKNYTPLHVHTSYSKLDGASKIHELVDRAKELGMNSLSITDHGTLGGWVPFYKECKSHDINPLLGCELYMADDRTIRENVNIENEHGEIAGSKHYYHLTAIAADNNGYQNLIKISSDAYLTGLYRKPRTDWEYLSQHSKGVIFGTGCLGSPILQPLLHGNFDKALETTARLKEIADPGNLFVEVMNHDLPEQAKTNPYLFDIAKRLDLPVCASLDSHYTYQSDADGHAVLLCCSTGSKMSDPNRFQFANDQYYLKSYDEMLAKFPQNPEVLSNTLMIAEKCNVEIDFTTQHLPNFIVPEGFENDVEYLRHLVYAGARNRYTDLSREVVERIDYELSVIANMGVSSYFLIVWDLIRFAEEQGIQKSPGRGSSSGSIAFYCLGVTQIDPLEYGLIFERFLNPSRITMPDADLDWPQRDREKIINYTREKYGEDHVSHIATFSRIKARTAVRDTARVMGFDYSVGDRISKAIPPLVSGVETPLYACLTREDKYAAGYQNAQELRNMYNSDNEVKQIVDTALKLEGQIRQSSLHAAGILIGDRPLNELVPLEKRKDGPIFTQWDKKMVESIGLVKMDYLGLINLDIISDTCKQVNISTDEIPFDDPKTYDLLRSGETLGVFQLDSKGMRDLLVKLKPDNLRDIAAVLALYRPGPMAQDWHNEYADVKNARRFNKPFHPDAAEILQETYNIPLFQEQLMAISQKFANYSMAEADNLRKIIGRKEVDEMVSERTKFVEGCIANGYEEELSNELFNKIDGFSLYGFSKLHALPYGLVSYWTAYLKANYPREYMSSLCSANMGDLEKTAVYLHEARRMGLKVYPPDLNNSSNVYTVEEDGIRMGLGAMKNMGVGAVKKLMKERDMNGKFVSLYDFAKRFNPNVSAFKSLAYSGALDSFGTRQGIAAIAEDVLKATRKEAKKNIEGQTSLFTASQGVEFSIPETEFSTSELLKKEKETLGIFVSGHPLDEMARQATDYTVSDLKDMDPQKKPVELLCMVSSIKTKYTKKGEAMAILNIEDQTGTLEVVVFPRSWAELKSQIAMQNIVYASLKIGTDFRDEKNYILQECRNITETRIQTEDFFGIYVPKKFHLNTKYMSLLKGIVLSHHGNIPLKLYTGRQTVLKLHNEYFVDPDDQMKKEVAELFMKYIKENRKGK